MTKLHGPGKDGRGRRPPAGGREQAPSGQPGFFSSQVTEAQRFFLDLEPPPGKRLAVVSGGRESCAPDYRIRRPGFLYRSIEFVARGEGSLRLGGEVHRLVPGAVFAYGPGIPHDIRTDPGRPLVKYFVDFAGRESRRLLRRPAPEPGRIVQTSSPDEVLRLFDDLVRSGRRSTPWSARICAAILEHLVLKIAETAIPLGAAGTLAFETFQRCRSAIDEGFLELRTLGDIARRCRVDPAYLCRLFGRFGHQSPYRYLVRLKMDHAARRLREPGALVKRVACEMGYDDPFHFSRAFKRVLGVPPGRFVGMGRTGR
jgi:AraC-like DNA-binding protein